MPIRDFERARVRENTDALAALGLTPEALALSARRLRRAREALDATAQSFLAANSETSEAGYALIDREALASAAQEIALRALAQLIGAVGGGETPLQLAKLEALLAALQAHPGKAHTLGRCRIEPASGRLGIFREVRGEGLPVTELLPGERALWDNRFRIELGADEPEPIMVKALGDCGCRELWRAWLSPGRCRDWPDARCHPAGAVGFSWDFRCLAMSLTASRPALPARRPSSVAGGSRERPIAQAVEKACTSLG